MITENPGEAGEGGLGKAENGVVVGAVRWLLVLAAVFGAGW